MGKTFWKGKLRQVICILILIPLGVILTNHSIFTNVYNVPEGEEYDSLISILDNIDILNSSTVRVEKLSCPDVGNGMMRGLWKSRPLSSKEELDINTFLETARAQHGMPTSMQRADGKCGSVTYPNLFWFRALCNPKGPTPCCFHGTCVARSADECQGPDCYDLRTPIHAEYSTWIPEDPRCKVKNFTAPEACDLLQGTRLVMVGDSLMRQLYTALLLILTNNKEDGAYISTIPKEIHDRCKGMYTFTEKLCRLYINTDAMLCKGAVSLHVKEYYHLADTARFHALVRTLLHVKNTIVLVGIGYHDSFDYNRVFNEYIFPVIQLMKRKNATWPRIIWSTNHKFGILKTPLAPQQDNNRVEIFNKFMIEYLRQYAVPIFDTYNMTSDVMSQDGGHFGLGLNLMKAQMLLNFLQELKYNEQK